MAREPKTPAAPAADPRGATPASQAGHGPALSVRTVPGTARRYRGGLCFGLERITVPLADLADAQIEMIKTDPLLLVEEIA